MPEADGIVGLAPGAARMMVAMTIQAVVFDIGGVLEINRDLGVTGMWESRLGLGPGELNERMADVWRGGSIGMISEDDVRQAVQESAWTAGRSRSSCPTSGVSTSAPPTPS
jgi:hypothetical protein